MGVRFFSDLSDGAQGHEGDGHVPVRNHSGDCYSHRPESGRLQESACQPRGSCHEGSQIHRQVHHPGPCHVEGEDEARDKGSQEGRQGLACGSAEEEHLSQHLRHICTWTFHVALCVSHRSSVGKFVHANFPCWCHEKKK